MTAWTPSPWFAHGKLGKSLQYGVTAGTPYDPSIGAKRRIAICGSPYQARGPELDAEDCANAHLMAAAPDMADALEQAEACMSIVEPRSDTKEYIRILDVVRAALAKARGEAP